MADNAKPKPEDAFIAVHGAVMRMFAAHKEMGEALKEYQKSIGALTKHFGTKMKAKA
jgi:hypothetical protein